MVRYGYISAAHHLLDALRVAMLPIAVFLVVCGPPNSFYTKQFYLFTFYYKYMLIYIVNHDNVKTYKALYLL
jgi:hypothetical protein